MKKIPNAYPIEIEIKFVEFIRSGMIYANTLVDGHAIDLTISADTSDFDKFTPDSFEGFLQDGEGEYCAWFDDFCNLHWLIKLYTGHIEYRTVRCAEILEEMAYEKYIYIS